MTIRPATVEDVDSILGMAADFIGSTPYAAQLAERPALLRGFVDRLVANDAGQILIATRGPVAVGMIALWLFEHPYSGEATASELVWWVNPSERGSLGVRLLKRAEQWARDRGAAVLQMIAPNDRVAAFYTACGYGFVESSYARRLG